MKGICLISIFWIYALTGHLFAKWAKVESFSEAFQKGRLYLINWYFGYMSVIIFWPILVSVGIIHGIINTYRDL